MKNILTLTLLIFISFQGFSQSCEPDTTIKTPGVYPDYLDTAYTRLYYEMVNQFLPPKDTNILYQGIPVYAIIDSIRVDSIVDMPASISYVSNPGSGIFSNTKMGCFVFYGTPADSEVGKYELIIMTTAFIRVSSIPYSYELPLAGPTLVVKKHDPVGISEHLQMIGISPNPLTPGHSCTVHSPTPIRSLTIINLNGQPVYHDQDINQKDITVEPMNIPPGIYFIRLMSEDGVFYRKMIVTEE